MTFILEAGIFANSLSLSFQGQHDSQIVVWDILLDIPFLETVLELYFAAALSIFTGSTSTAIGVQAYVTMK